VHELRLLGPESVAVFDGTAVELLVIGHCILSLLPSMIVLLHST